MIVLDTSALIAIIQAEPDALDFIDRLAARPDVLLPASAFVEAALVLGGRGGSDGVAELRRVVAAYGIKVVAFTPAHAEAAADAFLRYGKGRHPAALNFGDCMSYAVAKVEGLPLLYVGDDFARTDVAAAQ